MISRALGLRGADARRLSTAPVSVVDHDAAAGAPGEDLVGEGRQLVERHLARHRLQGVGVEHLAEAGPRRRPALGRAHHGVDAVQRDPAQQERDDRRRQVVAAGQTAGRDGAAVARLGEDVGERGAADGVDGAGPALGQQRSLRRAGDLGPVDDGGGPDGAQRVALRVDPARRRRDLVAEPGQQADRRRADAAGRARDEHRLARGHAVALQLVDGHHRREAGRADGHRLARRQTVGQRAQPVALDPGLGGVPAPPHLADAPAGQHDPVARRVARVGRRRRPCRPGRCPARAGSRARAGRGP